MGNRLANPVPQYLNASGEILAGGFLFFYTTGTTTKTNTYTTAALSVANANPVVLDSAGRAPAIFLDPAVTYSVVLAPSTDTDPPGAAIWTRDPVVDLAANINAAFQVYAGDPNGNVAGNQGSVGGVGASAVFDSTNDILYICTTTGTASTAVWTQQGGALTGQVTQTGVITPTTLAANTDNWAPTDLDISSVIRVAASAAYNLTGITAQPTGTLLTLHNIGSFNITLIDDATSTAANRFQLPSDTVLAPDGAISLRYDGVSSRWRQTGLPSRVTGQQTIWIPAAAMDARVTTAPAAPAVVEIGTSLIALRTMNFATDADDHAGFAIQMPKGWNEGTLVAQFVWSTDGTQGAGNDGVAWFIRAGAYASDDVLTAALGTAVGATAQNHSATANDIMITAETAAITVAGSPGAEEWVYFEFYRDTSDAGDDLDIAARLHGIKIHYSTDSVTDD